MAELILQLPDGRTIRHRLGTSPIVVGRELGCEIFIDDPSTSRRHARFSCRGNQFFVEDLGSKNGTLVNDQAASALPLVDGDQILVGAALAIFREKDDGTTSPSVVISDDATTERATRYAAKDQRLVLPQRRLEMIYDLSERLTTLQSQDALLENALDICFETLQFERGAVGVRRPGQKALDWPVVRNLRGAQGELSISRSLLNRALEHGERAAFSDSAAGNADPTMSIVQHGIRSAMCVPLVHRDQTLGVIYGDRTTSPTPYSSEDVDFLAGIAQQISIGLINARLVEEQRQMIRLHHDLEVARRIQTALFPQALPNRDDIKAAAINDPGQRISGDYYDFIERTDGRVWCVVADVTGEGVSAALLMANMQAAVRVLVEQTDDPGELLTACNRLICRNTDGSKFVTCLCALVDAKHRRIRFASAGHLLPVLIPPTDDPLLELDAAGAGFPLGVDKDSTFEADEVTLIHPSTLLFGYTDGVIEAMDPEGSQFGRERMLQALLEQRNATPLAIVRHIRKAVSQFVGAAPQSDDITMLAVRIG